MYNTYSLSPRRCDRVAPFAESSVSCLSTETWTDDHTATRCSGTSTQERETVTSYNIILNVTHTHSSLQKHFISYAC